MLSDYLKVNNGESVSTFSPNLLKFRGELCLCTQGRDLISGSKVLCQVLQWGLSPLCSTLSVSENHVT